MGTLILLADPREVFRILSNLVNNAITVARQGGEMSSVTLLVERTDTTVTVRIADDGPGLPAAIRTIRAPPTMQAEERGALRSLGWRVAQH